METYKVGDIHVDYLTFFLLINFQLTSTVCEAESCSIVVEVVTRSV